MDNAMSHHIIQLIIDYNCLLYFIIKYICLTYVNHFFVLNTVPLNLISKHDDSKLSAIIRVLA